MRQKLDVERHVAAMHQRTKSRHACPFCAYTTSTEHTRQSHVKNQHGMQLSTKKLRKMVADKELEEEEEEEDNDNEGT